MKFNELELSPEIQSALALSGFETATEVQEKSIPVILDGKDIVVRSQTGSGKTLAFGLPVIQNIDFDTKSTQALIVCPTRELAVQVTEELRKITRSIEGIKVVPVYGGADINKQIMALKSNAKIVVGTPGRIMDHLNRKTLKLSAIRFLILDEADEMLNMGFKDDIEKILASTNTERQTLMFSATFPPAILALTQNYQRDAVRLQIGEDKKSLDSINQSYVFVGKEQKTDVLIALYRKFSPKLSIIFCNTKRMTETLVSKLAAAGITAVALNGDMRQGSRKKTLDAVRKGSENILIATDVAARGIDINNVDYVFNYDLPNNVEYYLHRIGRTARAGKEGNSVAILNTRAQVSILKEYERETNSEITFYSMGSGFDAGNNSERPTRPQSKPKNFNFDPFAKKEGGFRQDRKPYKSFGDKKEGGFRQDRKPYKSFEDKKDGEFSSSAKTEGGYRQDRKPYKSFDDKKDGEFSSSARKEGGYRQDRKPYKSFEDKKDGEFSSTAKTEGGYRQDRKPYKSFEDKKDGEFSSSARKEGGFRQDRKPYKSFEDKKDGEFSSTARKEGEFKQDRKPYKPRVEKKDNNFDPYAKKSRPLKREYNKPADGGDGRSENSTSGAQGKPFRKDGQPKPPFARKRTELKDTKKGYNPFPNDDKVSETERRKVIKNTDGYTDARKENDAPRQNKTFGDKKPFNRNKPSSGFGGTKFGSGSKPPKRNG